MPIIWNLVCRGYSVKSGEIWGSSPPSTCGDRWRQTLLRGALSKVLAGSCAAKHFACDRQELSLIVKTQNKQSSIRDAVFGQHWEAIAQYQGEKRSD